MKNKEKYKNELIDSLKRGNSLCEFVRQHDVFRTTGRQWDNYCNSTNCYTCITILNLWLDEEYEMSEADWNRVPVDTLVLVRNSKNENWTLRHFKRIRDTTSTHRFETWDDGRTSKTTDGLIALWRYCKLAEEV